MSRVSALVGSTQRALSRSRVAVLAARKIRNQAEMILQWYLGEDQRREMNGELRLINQVAPHVHSFIDVGANVGEWSDLVVHAGNNRKCGIMVEPSESAIEKLRERFAKAKDLRIIQAAVSDFRGEALFYDEGDAGETSSLLKCHHSFGRRLTPVKIPVTTLDEEARAAEMASVDLVKIDTEGSDFHVIRGAKDLLERMAIGLLQFEYNGAWAYAGSTLGCAIAYLEERAYKVYLIRTTGLHPLNYRRWGEYYRTSNFLAVAPQCSSMVSRLIGSEI